MPDTTEPTAPVSYADQMRAVAVRRFNIVDEIDDAETLKKFRQINPRHSEERSRIEHLHKGHLLVIEDGEYREITALLRRIQKATGSKYKAIRNNGKIFVGHDIQANLTQ